MKRIAIPASNVLAHAIPNRLNMACANSGKLPAKLDLQRSLRVYTAFCRVLYTSVLVSIIYQ